VTARSDVCTSCFKKYCYDPTDPPPPGQIVGRRFKFKDPDPFGIKTFFQNHKTAIIVGAVFAALVLIGSIAGCVLFCRKRYQGRKARSAAYQRLRGDGSEWSAFMGRQSYEMATPHDQQSESHSRASHYQDSHYEDSHYRDSHYQEPHHQEPQHQEPLYQEPQYQELRAERG
jgi:hypothetical protein